MRDKQQLLREIPAIHELIQASIFKSYLEENAISSEQLTLLCQSAVEEIRQAILAEAYFQKSPSLTEDIVNAIYQRLEGLLASPLKPVLNGTGVILHTNLGRAKLSKEAQEELQRVATYYSNLEFNLLEGTRGSRHAIVEDIICQLTGAEAALVCNNNASAVYLILKEFAQNKEVIVSRGELVEIGGSFRVSEIMKASGATLVEVGTTNKTHGYDYLKHISEDTAMILKVHTSNFVIKGFTASVERAELVQLVKDRNIILYEDLGSGVLYDLKQHGIGTEPTVQEVIQAGVDLVSFSGDKLLGGPQAGIIAGKRELIARLKKNQLMRSLRVDKFTLAALHATLRAYLSPEKAADTIPTLSMILEDKAGVEARAKTFIKQCTDINLTNTFQFEAIDTLVEVGGGTLPDVEIPSCGVSITPLNISVSSLTKALRQQPFPVVGRIQDNSFIIDFRTIADHELPILIEAFSKL